MEFPVGKRWYIDENEARVVRLIFDLYTAPEHRLGCKRTTNVLNEKGCTTRNGLAWLSNYVMRLISNPAYAGFTSFDEQSYDKRIASSLPRNRQTLFKGEHEPLITPEVWKRANELRAEGHTKRDQRTPGRSRVFSLTGILRCPTCNSRMIGKWSSHSPRSYYLCARRHNGGPSQCSFPLLDANQLHRETWRWVHMLISSPDYVKEHLLRAEKKLDQERPQVEKDLARLSSECDEVRASLQKYYAMFERSKDPARDAMFLERVEELRTRLQSLEAEEQQLRARAQPPRPKLTIPQVQKYLAQLQQRAEERPELQKAMFQELKRQHGLTVRAKSSSEIVVSLDLISTVENDGSGEGSSSLTNSAPSRFYSVLNPRDPGWVSGPGLRQDHAGAPARRDPAHPLL
jgi:site-specific DNA recombinase